jgi:nitrate reductase gamma subunit
MMLVGCLLALAWRAGVQNRPERKFSDTPMVVFLLVVVVTGFVVEGWRLALAPATAHHAYSFVGQVFAQGMTSLGWISPALYKPLWVVHVVASCAFIGWLPATRLIHTCATPLGRLLHSQTGLLAAKKNAVLSGLMRPRQQPRP